MEKTEPTLVPEWLKNSASSTGGCTISHADDQSASRVSRIKSFVNTNGHDFRRLSTFERTKSSYFRRSSSGSSSGNFRSYSSSGRNRRDREWEKDAYGSRDQEKLILEDHRYLEYSEPEGSTLPSRLNGLRRSQSMVSAKRGDTWHKKVVPDVTSVGVKSNDGLLLNVSLLHGVNKTTFERDFPSLGAEERTVASDAGRVPSPGLTTAIQSLPIGSSTSPGGEKWTSALAEIPLLVGSNGTASSSASQVASSSSTSLASGAAVSFNMAEAVAHGPIRTLTSPQKHEDMTIKQSRQLIPVTPSMPRTSMLNSLDKPKGKAGQLQPSTMYSLPVSHSTHSMPSKDDVSKASYSGKLHILKSMQEKNGLASVVNDNLSTTSGNRIGSSMLAASPSFSVSAATRIQANNAIPNRKPVLTVLEKRPTSQARSRNDFFNLVRKKAMADSPSTADSNMGNSSSTADSDMANSSYTADSDMANSSYTADSDMTNSSSVLGTCNMTSPSFSSKHSEMEGFPTTDAEAVDTPVRSVSLDVNNLSEKTDVLTSNEDACCQYKHVINGKKDPCSGSIIPDEEEAAFLRSLGWEENDEQGDLTEEEISAFRMELTKYIESNPSLRILQGTQLRFLLPLDSRKENVISSALTTHDAKLES